jgi:hypothetical protein
MTATTSPSRSAPVSRPDEFHVSVRDRLIAAHSTERFDPRALYSTMYGPTRMLPSDWTRRSHAFMKTLSEYGWTEPAPGPRGGAGWRIRPDHLAEIQAKAASADRLNGPHRTAAAAISSPYATTTLCDVKHTVTLYWGWLPGGLDAGTVVKRVPLRDLRRPSSRTLTAAWRHHAKLAAAATWIDARIARLCEQRAASYQDLVGTLLAYAKKKEPSL